MARYKGEEIDLKPTQGMADEAQKGIEWREEFKRGGTRVGVARARQLIARSELSPDTVRRMHSFFSRHEVDKQAEGFKANEDGYPSAGRIAWALWGGDPGQTWARSKRNQLEKIDERGQEIENTTEFERALSGKALEGVKNKVKEHNEEHGSVKSKRVTVSMLSKVYERGVGAYKTNPGSVRPTVNSPEQWAMARVNSFLFAVRNGRFRSGKHDTDLLPEGHPMKSDEKKERHIKNVQETEDSYIIEFGKSMEQQQTGEDKDDLDIRPYGDHEDDDERAIDENATTIEVGASDLLYRLFDGDKKIDKENRTVQVGVSSEQPVSRSFGKEVIDHSRENMNLEFLNSGRAPLLLNHNMESQIGVVESVELDEDARRLRASVRFGKGERASEVFEDVTDGIRQNISVGYRIDRRVEREDDPDDYYRVATTPMEISIVSIPADQSNQVGVGREFSEKIEPTVKIEEERDVKMSDEIDTEQVKAEAQKIASRNAREIVALARKHNKQELAEKALEQNATLDEFRGMLLEEIKTTPIDTPAHVVDAPVKEQRTYNLANMIRAQVKQDWRDAGFEREMHDEIAQRLGKQSDGIYVPDFAWTRSGVMTTGATGAISGENVQDNFVPTIQRGDLFIEALRANQVMSNLGVTFMSGLTNRVRIPKFSVGATAGFVEEAGSVSDQSQTDDAVTLQPRTFGAKATMSRLLMMESVPAIENLVQNDLLRAMANGIEFHAIQGSGSSGQPTGLLNTSGVGNVDISSNTDVAALTWQDLTDLVKTVEEANGMLNQNSVGWLTNPKVKAKLANTVKVSSTDSIMLLNDPWNAIYGYKAEFTTNVPSDLDPGDGGSDGSAIIFGDFSQLMIGLFGAPSILVDPYTGSSSGDVTINVFQEIDVAVRHAVSFAKSDEVSTA